MYFNRIFIKSLGIIVLILLNSCQEKSNKSVDGKPDKIAIESPIVARLEMEDSLVAKLTFANVSDRDVIVTKQKLGGEKLKEHIFHLNPWYTSPNITFKPYKSFLSLDSKYIIMKPQEVIVTYTDLKKYYDFNERKYGTLTIAYVGIMDCLDKDYKQITERDTDTKIKPVVFYIFSNDIDLDYNKDIKPYL